MLLKKCGLLGGFFLCRIGGATQGLFELLAEDKEQGHEGRTRLVSLRTRTRWRPWELSPSAPVASARSPYEKPRVLYHAVCGSIRTQRDFPLSGYAWHQRKAFSLDEQVQRKSSTISTAQQCIAGRVGRNFKRPG